jgi:hypothetical protein
MAAGMNAFRSAVRRWASWSLPTRLGLTMGVLGVLGVAITFAAWRWPTFWDPPAPKAETAKSNPVDPASAPKAEAPAPPSGPTTVQTRNVVRSDKKTRPAQAEAAIVIQQQTFGDNSPAIVANGDVTIGTQEPGRTRPEHKP